MATKLYVNVEQNAVPSDAKHLVTKGYVDAALSKKIKDAVVVVTTADLDCAYDSTAMTLTQNTAAPFEIDGETLDVGDRILVCEQSDATQNGIYVVMTQGVAESVVGAGDGVPGVLKRAEDFDEQSDLALNVMIPVQKGSSADSTWVMTNDTLPTIDSTAINFSTFRAPDSAVAVSKTFDGDDTTKEWTINHGLNTEDITVNIVDATDKTPCYFDYEITSANVVTVKADAAPATGESFIITIVG